MLEATIASLACLMLLLGIYNLLGFRREKRDWNKRVSEVMNKGEKRKSFIVVLGDKFDSTEFAQPLYEKLRYANIRFTPSEFYGALFVLTAGIIVVLQNFFSIKFPISFIISLLLVDVSKRVFFYLRKNKLNQQLNEQLPEICRILANSTRSGMTLTQGINLVAQEVNEPAKTEFKRLANEIAIGVDFNRALKMMENRIPSREFKLFVATLLIQKKAGGNLFAVLDEMSQTLDERKVLLQEIKTMTAEQRYTSYMVPVIPIFLVLMMNNIIDGFIDPLFSGIGVILLILFIAGIALTFFLVRKVTNIKV